MLEQRTYTFRMTENDKETMKCAIFLDGRFMVESVAENESEWSTLALIKSSFNARPARGPLIIWFGKHLHSHRLDEAIPMTVQR